jgi:Protein of unknown function (DUF4232)
MTKTFALLALVPVALITACGSGAKQAGPVPTAGSPQGTTRTTASAGTSTSGSSSGSTSGGSQSTSTASTSSTPPLCSEKTAKVQVSSQQGAAGTIGTVWRVENRSASACRSFGYPGMDFHTADGWLDVHVQRGGVAIVNDAPSSVLVQPGDSLYFMSLWGTVDTNAGPCKRFDRVKVTLPDNFTSARVAASGCLDPDLVRVGPVRSTPPA